MGAGARNERAVHMDVVAAEVEGDEPLKDDGATGVGRREEAKQARRRAAIRHHVQHGAKFCALAKCPSGNAVGGVEEARNAVEKRAGLRVRLHVVKRQRRQHDSGVP